MDSRIITWKTHKNSLLAWFLRRAANREWPLMAWVRYLIPISYSEISFIRMWQSLNILPWSWPNSDKYSEIKDISINLLTIMFLFGSTFSIIRKSTYANFSDMHHIPRKMSYNYHAIVVTFTFHLQIVVRWMLLDINDRIITSFFFGTLILIFLFQISSMNIEIDVELFD